MKKFFRIASEHGHLRFYLFGLRILSFKVSDFDELYALTIKKYKALREIKPEITTLVLGSSHGRDAYICDNNAFNLSGTSLDLYRIYHLYLWMMQNHPSKIKNIIVFYDVFHAGLQLEKTRNALRTVPYKLFYNIDYAFPLSKQNIKAESSLIKKLQKRYQSMPMPSPSYRGNIKHPTSHKSSKDTELKVQGHLKNNMRGNNQDAYIESLAKQTEARNQNLFIVTSPYRQDYLSFLPPYETVFSQLLRIAKEHPSVHILNYQNDKDFSDDDFYDSDHLNQQGAEKLTNKITQDIARIS